MTLYRTDSFVFINGELTRSPMSIAAAQKSLRKYSLEDTTKFFEEAEKIKKTYPKSAKLERLMKRWNAHGKARENHFNTINFNPKNPEHWHVVDNYDV